MVVDETQESSAKAPVKVHWVLSLSAPKLWKRPIQNIFLANFISFWDHPSLYSIAALALAYEKTCMSLLLGRSYSLIFPSNVPRLHLDWPVELQLMWLFLGWRGWSCWASKVHSHGDGRAREDGVDEGLGGDEDDRAAPGWVQRQVRI